MSLQSGFSETLSNEGGGGGRIKPNPQHRLSIKPGEFTASPSDTANTGSEQLLGSPQGPDLPVPSLYQKGNGAAALGRSPREARTPLGSAFTHQHRAKLRDPRVMPQWVLRPRAGPTSGAQAAGMGDVEGMRRWRPGRRNPTAASDGWERCRWLRVTPQDPKKEDAVV